MIQQCNTCLLLDSISNLRAKVQHSFPSCILHTFAVIYAVLFSITWTHYLRTTWVRTDPLTTETYSVSSISAIFITMQRRQHLMYFDVSTIILYTARTWPWRCPVNQQSQAMYLPITIKYLPITIKHQPPVPKNMHKQPLYYHLMTSSLMPVL